MVRLFNILDYWAQLAQHPVALPGGVGYPCESPDRVRLALTGRNRTPAVVEFVI